jgi:transposase
MELRHLPILGYRTFIQLTPKRGICTTCDDGPTTTTQTLDWYDRNARQTKPYESHLLFELINTTVSDVSRKEDIDYRAIENILNKHIATDVDFSTIFFLGVLGIDEISLRKGRKQYVTVITYRHNHEVRVLKVLEGRDKKDVKSFFKSIPKRLKITVSAVCSDLYDGYINAAKEVFGSKVITADRFHVAKLYRKQLITVRKSELRRLKKLLSPADYKSLKSAISLLRKGRDYFTEEETETVAPLFRLAPKLKLAYKFSHRLTSIFNSDVSKKDATEQFRQWISDASSSELKCFKTFIGTFSKYMNEITNYFLEKNSSGFVEGFNNRLKVLTRRCYGLKSVGRFFQRIKLDTEGFDMFKFSAV